MKTKPNFTKKDFIVTLACVLFLLANIAAIGTSGRGRAKEAVCLSNLKQLGSAAAMFMVDNDGYFHRGNCSGGTHIDYWVSAWEPYYGSEYNLCLCPEATKLWSDGNRGKPDAAWGEWESTTVWVKKGQYGSYGINSWVCNNPIDSEDYWRRNDVKGANAIPLLLDALWIYGWPQPTDEPPDYDGQYFLQTTSSMARFCTSRHYGAINGLFLDFSARKIGLKELWLLKWSRTYDVEWARQNEPDWTIGTGWIMPLKDYDYIP